MRDRYGWRLALVFGNHAPGGVCPYYTGERCFHCDIGAGEGAAFDLTTNRQRLAWFREHYRPHLASISHLVLYNSGSILNPREMPPELLDEIVAFARSLPAVRVDLARFARGLHQAGRSQADLSVLGAGFTVRPILGIESADDRHPKRGPCRKRCRARPSIGYSRDLGRLAAEFGQERIGLDVNIVIAGPGTTRETAVDDAVMTARFALIAGAVHERQSRPESPPVLS